MSEEQKPLLGEDVEQSYGGTSAMSGMMDTASAIPQDTNSEHATNANRTARDNSTDTITFYDWIPALFISILFLLLVFTIFQKVKGK